jgi:hypothetical protein
MAVEPTVPDLSDYTAQRAAEDREDPFWAQQHLAGLKARRAQLQGEISRGNDRHEAELKQLQAAIAEFEAA